MKNGPYNLCNQLKELIKNIFQQQFLKQFLITFLNTPVFSTINDISFIHF